MMGGSMTGRNYLQGKMMPRVEPGPPLAYALERERITATTPKEITGEARRRHADPRPQDQRRLCPQGRGHGLRLPLVVRDAARPLPAASRSRHQHLADQARHQYRHRVLAEPDDHRAHRLGPAEG